MTEHNCQSIRDLLVDYADGELSPVDAQAVASHLAGCAGCRAELRLLEQSLELAQAVWRELAEPEKLPSPIPGEGQGVRASGPAPCPTRPRRRLAATAIAAAIVIVVMALPWLVPHGAPVGIARKAAGPKDATAGHLPDAATMTAEDIDRYLAREASAARLSAAAELLGTQPGLEEHRRRAERYIIDTYGDTAAGRELSARASHKSSQEPQS